jgi:hypothetical protein
MAVLGSYDYSLANYGPLKFRASDFTWTVGGSDDVIGKASAGSKWHFGFDSAYGGASAVNVYGDSQLTQTIMTLADRRADAANSIAVYVVRAGAVVGSIATTDTATSYATTSDYRLKDVAGRLQDPGTTIDALRPLRGTWKRSGARFIGFLAHEVAAVIPEAVVGEKDAVDADGNPIYQSMSYASAELITCMVAELQSLRARLVALEARP